MSIHLRKLVSSDIEDVNSLVDSKLSQNQDEAIIFEGFENKKIFNLYMLPEHIKGSEKYNSIGYFVDGKLQAIIGTRDFNDVSWILSFIVTAPEIKNGVEAIRALLKSAIELQEHRGMFHWYVISKGEKFLAWQRLFKHLRSRYHHYVYAQTPANQLPKFNFILALTGSKLFPYDTTVSMYVSKSICTSIEKDQ